MLRDHTESMKHYWHEAMYIPSLADADAAAPADDLDLTEITPLVTALALPFVTVDLARHDDGRWRVVELGDGQVSDRPRTMSATELVSVLA